MFHWWFKKIKGSGTNKVKKDSTVLIDLLEQAKMCCVLAFLGLPLVLLPWLWQVTDLQFRRDDLVMEAALLISNRL